MLFAALLIAQVVHPAAAVTPCPAASTALPSNLSGWRHTAPGPNISQAFIVHGGDPALVKGGTAEAAARPGQAALVPFEILAKGTYRIALSEGAWVDVMAGTKTLPSIAHAHGPDCSGIRKLVNFNLPAGRYAMRLSGMKTATIRVMIVPAR